ncbi:hypothetical protein QFC20_006417 [Naganishia adeliensis]|uniref:Uncharacterized protein n=1 Tax=Naganishia adeliensis TaxID=92952 RepID=A0ACC2VBK5_9TREE|nr:hypothetical protein QFC20_006417 [Naganishia adeliensis]
MFARLATSSVRIASRGTRSAATFTTEGVKGNDFKALRDATKQHAAAGMEGVVGDAMELEEEGWVLVSWKKRKGNNRDHGLTRIFARNLRPLEEDLGALWVKQVEDEHHHHLQHLKEENGGELPERPVYPYMNIRNKPEVNIAVGDE